MNIDTMTAEELARATDHLADNFLKWFTENFDCVGSHLADTAQRVREASSDEEARRIVIGSVPSEDTFADLYNAVSGALKGDWKNCAALVSVSTRDIETEAERLFNAD